jgi:hypothetical protein
LLPLLTVIRHAILQILPKVFDVEIDTFHDGIGLHGCARQHVCPYPSYGLNRRLSAGGGMLL